MKKRGYIAAASLLESVIAISIIAACLLVGLQVFGTVLGNESTAEHYKLSYNRSKALAKIVLETDTATLKAADVLNRYAGGNLESHYISIPDGQTLTVWKFKATKP